MRKIQIKAKNINQALNFAAEKFNVSQDELDYEIKSKKGGLLGTKECEVLIWVKSDQLASAAAQQTAVVSDSEPVADAEPEIQDVNGFFRIEKTEDTVYLTVFPPKGNGNPAHYEKVLTKFLEQDIEADEKMIEQVVAQAEGERVKVAEWKSTPGADSKIHIDISKDEMKAFITLTPPAPGGRVLVIEEILKQLEDAGVTKGIKNDLIYKLLDNKIFNEQFLVAEGSPAEDGEDAKVNYKFRTDKVKSGGFIDESGSIDYKNLDLIENVVQSQLLVEKIPPTEGKPGFTVTGRELTARPGKDIKMPIGKNVILSEDGMEATAGMNGEVSLIDGRITVNPVYTVNGNVNLETGNIVFLGNVEVRGNVEDNFSVKASGDIRIGGSVGKAFLEADGDIFVTKGILGRSEGKVYAEGNVYAKFIENGNVYAGMNIYVFEASMHSNLNSGGTIIISGKKGLIVGGTARARDEIYVVNAGSGIVATPTTLEVGADPHIREKLAKMNKQRQEFKKNLQRLEQGIKTLEALREKLTILPPEKEQTLTQFMNAESMLEEKLEMIEGQIIEMENRIVTSKTGTVSVQNAASPGVKIIIKDKIYIVKEELKFVSFIFSEGDVKIMPYKEVKQSLKKDMQKR